MHLNSVLIPKILLKTNVVCTQTKTSADTEWSANTPNNQHSEFVIELNTIIKSMFIHNTKVKHQVLNVKHWVTKTRVVLEEDERTQLE